MLDRKRTDYIVKRLTWIIMLKTIHLGLDNAKKYDKKYSKQHNNTNIMGYRYYYTTFKNKSKELFCASYALLMPTRIWYRRSFGCNKKQTDSQ